MGARCNRILLTPTTKSFKVQYIKSLSVHTERLYLLIVEDQLNVRHYKRPQNVGQILRA